MKERLQQQQPLRQYIDELLVEAGHAEPSKWQNELRGQLLDVPNAERVYINNGLRRILSAIDIKNDIDTTSARYCLNDQIDFHDWYHAIKQMVVPLLIKYY